MKRQIEAWAVVNWKGEIVQHHHGAVFDTPNDLVITTDEQHAISSCDHRVGERVVKVTITIEG